MDADWVLTAGNNLEFRAVVVVLLIFYDGTYDIQCVPCVPVTERDERD